MKKVQQRMFDVRSSLMNRHGAPQGHPKEKAARRRLFNSNLMNVDQAAIYAGSDFRR
jgi:hypothetical protein